MIKYNKIWEKLNFTEINDFSKRVDRWYEGKESGKKVLMYLEEKDINSEFHDSKLHEWLKTIGWQICRLRRSKKVKKMKFTNYGKITKKIQRITTINKNEENRTLGHNH